MQLIASQVDSMNSLMVYSSCTCLNLCKEKDLSEFNLSKKIVG